VTTSIKRNILLNPGPATTTDSVKMAMVVPDICPREQDFVNIMSEVMAGLLRVVGADEEYDCVIFAGSGTAIMDSVINSVVPLQGKLLIINNGAYGERIVNIAAAYNIEYVELEFPWTEQPELSLIEETLKRDISITHIALVHHETTTGLLNPLKDIGAISHAFGKSLICDAISSFAGIPINIGENNIDYLMSTSNKCIQGMAGCSFAICKNSEIIKSQNIPKRSFYLNLYNQHKYFQKQGEMQFTPPVQVMYALKQAISEYFEEGGTERYKRYCKNWDILTEGLTRMGFDLLLGKELQSKLLVTVIEPEHEKYNFYLMHDLLYKRSFTIYPGKIGNFNTFRIAVMGAIDSQDIKRFLNALREVLHIMNVDLQ